MERMMCKLNEVQIIIIIIFLKITDEVYQAYVVQQVKVLACLLTMMFQTLMMIFFELGFEWLRLTSNCCICILFNNEKYIKRNVIINL